MNAVRVFYPDCVFVFMKKSIIARHTVPFQETPIRISDYLKGIFPQVPSRKQAKKVLKAGLVSVNGETATTASFLKGGEQIELSEAENPVGKPIVDLPIEVLFEDDFLAVVHKPAGLLVHGNKKFTLVNALPSVLRPSKEEDALPRPLPIHRLDYPTSGALIVAKTRQTILELGVMLEARKIRKEYLAVAIGRMTSEKETLSDFIEGKEAITHYEIMQSVVSDRFGALNLLKIQLETGRKHQIRIHLSSIGHPILGDKTYGIENKILKGNGLYLHAHRLVFQHPISGKPLEVKVSVPKKFLRIFPEQPK